MMNEAPPVDPAILLERSGAFLRDPMNAWRACEQYLASYAETAAARDVGLTLELVRTIVSVSDASRGTFASALDYALLESISASFREDLPPVLANGVITDERVILQHERPAVVKNVLQLQNLGAKLLGDFFSALEAETAALLVDGETRAVVEELTLEEAYQRAEVHYRSYAAGNLPEALQGFMHLKSMNPKDAYFRDVLGAIHVAQGNPRQGLCEFLYAVFLDPGEPTYASHLVTELCKAGLHPSALEVHRHYERYAQPDMNPNSVAALGAFLPLLRIATVALSSVGANVNVSPGALSGEHWIKDVDPVAREWLPPPQELAEASNTLDGKRIFLSYRRAGASKSAERLEGSLLVHFPRTHVFRDQTAMVAGERFTDRLREEIDGAHLFLWMIDPSFGSPEGLRRLHEVNDFVRRELARAQSRHVPIVPILVEGASMLRAADLPRPLDALASIHAWPLRIEQWDADLGRLEVNLVQIMRREAAHEQETEVLLDELTRSLTSGGPQAKEERGRMTAGAVSELPRFEAVQVPPGVGVPTSTVEWHGTWEVTVVSPNGLRRWLRLVTHAREIQSVRGTARHVEHRRYRDFQRTHRGVLAHHHERRRYGTVRASFRHRVNGEAGDHSLAFSPKGRRLPCWNGRRGQ